MAHLTPELVSSSIHAHHDQSFFVYRPHCLTRAVETFTQQFNGTCLYAVKTNPDPAIIQALYTSGITSFDVASLNEIITIRNICPSASLYFMHPVKSRHAIAAAYFDHGIRHFSLDSAAELHKISQATNHASDLHLHVRVAIPNNFAEMTLTGKFGVALQDAPALIRQTAQVAEATGVCFHAGSQCMHPEAYRIAIRMSRNAIAESGVNIDYFDVGGGFPSIYPGMTPPPMHCFFDAIHEEFAHIPGHQTMQLLAEPGRALVAESMALIVQVMLRKHDMLYINDGTYGSLFDAGTPQFIFPNRLLRSPNDPHQHAFSFYGPTCDALDVMKGPFYLPDTVDEGDYIEIGQMGAYGRHLATRFNGFHPHETMLTVNDEPIMSMYRPDAIKAVAA